MKNILLASALLVVSSSAALAQFPVLEGDPAAELAEGQKTIVDLVSEGYEIKATVGPLIILQDDKALYGCSAGRTGPADLKAGVIPASKIPCVPIK